MPCVPPDPPPPPMPPVYVPVPLTFRSRRVFAVADILKGTRSPKEGLEDLMTMPLKAEMYDA